MIPGLRLGLFIVMSIVLASISRTSLLRPGSHGFYRFFAWESILALLLINVTSWFTTPTRWNQLVSWLLLVVSLIPLIMGVRQLRAEGQTDSQKRSEAELMGFERTTRLITDGIYRWIRHPLYCSLLLLAWGIFFKVPTATAGALALAATGFLVLTARADERECRKVFGADYAAYMKQTKMFIPYVV